MSKAIVSQQPQPVQVPKRPHLCRLPSGRVIEMGNIVDCYRDPTHVTDGQEDLRLERITPNGIQVVLLDGEDAHVAEQVMQALALITFGTRPTAPQIEIAPASALRNGA